jgi:hypothetical protein
VWRHLVHRLSNVTILFLLLIQPFDEASVIKFFQELFGQNVGGREHSKVFHYQH